MDATTNANLGERILIVEFGLNRLGATPLGCPFALQADGPICIMLYEIKAIFALDLKRFDRDKRK
jgi:hypothetical protein